MHRDPYAGVGCAGASCRGKPPGAQAGRLGRLALLFSLHAAGIYQHLRDVPQRLLIL